MTLSPENEFIWEYRINDDPEDALQTTGWIPYADTVSLAIEEAYKQHNKQMLIDENYRIDLRNNRQEHINNPHLQQPVRRRSRIPSPIPDEIRDELSRGERLSSPLGLLISRSATGDTAYYGSLFVHTWLVMFTEGKMKVKFDTIFLVLVKGLIKEGENDTENKVPEVEAALSEVEEETRGKSSKQRLMQLQDCCAKLYTKGCYIYRAVNAALRDNNLTKLYTLGPFCYLLFNWIGRRVQSKSSTRDRLRRFFRPEEMRSVLLYRGDRSSDTTVEEYRRAAGDDSKYFKWLPFVSTTYDRAVAEKFAVDILYIIEVQSFLSNQDQFTDMAAISHYGYEKEILLLPGVQFQVTKVEYDDEKKLDLVFIKINSSYTSKLK